MPSNVVRPLRSFAAASAGRRIQHQHRSGHRRAELGGARPVGRRLILDAFVLIAYERGTMDRSSLDDDELAIAAVSVAEYRAGIELTGTADRARALAAITSAVEGP